MIGRTLSGKYRVDAKIGEGSMGQVYRAEHVGLKKRVALKVLHSDMQVTEETLQRFQREGIAAGRFSHPNAIQIFDFDQDESDFFLAMEYVEGSDLKAFLREHAPLTAEEAIEIVRQSLAALAEAHEQGIVHRDLKPENIMVARGASGAVTVKVLDFGLSKLVHIPMSASLQTQPGRIMGTPLYMSPEQSTGDDVDHRSDLYSLGIILYEMLAGSLPFKGDSLTELLLNQVTAEIPALHEVVPDVEVPVELQDFLDRVLEKDREERFQSAVEMLDALDAIELDGTPGTRGKSRPRGAAKRPSTPSRRSRAVREAERAEGGGVSKGVMAAIAVVVLGAAAAGVFFMGGEGEEQVAAPDPVEYARVREKPAAERSADENRYNELLDSARSALRSGDGDAALANAEEAYRLECRDPEALFVRARAYRARGDVDTARADLREVLRVEPNFASAEAELGWIELASQQLDSAAQHFTAAEELEPQSADALAGSGAVAYLRGDIDRAEGLLERAVELSNELADAHYYRGRILLDRGESRAAIDELVEAKRSNPRFAPALVALGAAYLAEGRTPEAERQLRDALELDPQLPEARETLAALHVAEERFDEARELLESGFSSQRSPREKVLLATVRMTLDDDMGSALDLVEEAADELDDDADVLTLLGVLYQTHGRERDALDAYEDALAIDNSLALPYANTGLLQFGRGEYEEASQSLEQAIVLVAENAEAHLALAILYMDYLGRPDRAADLLRDYQLLGGGDSRVDDWLERIGG